LCQAITDGKTTRDLSGTVKTVLEKVGVYSQAAQELLDEMDAILFEPVENVTLEAAKSVCRRVAVLYSTLVELVEELNALAKKQEPALAEVDSYAIRSDKASSVTLRTYGLETV